MKFDPNTLNRRDSKILKALLYFYPRKKSAAQMYTYISKYSQKTGLKGAKALGHILVRFPVKSELTVASSMTKNRIVNCRYVRLYVLKDSFVKKYYKEKNDLIKLGKRKSKNVKRKKSSRK